MRNGVGGGARDQEDQGRIAPESMTFSRFRRFAERERVGFFAGLERDSHVRNVEAVWREVVTAFPDEILGAQVGESFKGVLHGIVVENALRRSDKFPFLLGVTFDNGLGAAFEQGELGDLVRLQLGNAAGAQRERRGRELSDEVGFDGVNERFVGAFDVEA